MKRHLIAAAVLLLVATGCGDTDDTKNATAAPNTEPTAQSGPTYADALNQLCDALIDDVVPITGDSARPTGAKYLADMKKVRPVWAAFDAQVADLAVVTDADRETAAAFDAFRGAGDAAEDAMPSDATIATMDATEFQGAFDEALAEAGFDTQRSKLNSLGVNCPAR